MKKFSPKTARTFKQICTLSTDSCHTPRAWMLVSEGGTLDIITQKLGHPSTGHVKLRKSDFEKMVRWYNRATGTQK